MDGALVLLSVCVVSSVSLAAWRWWLDEQTRQFRLDLEARAARETAKGAHELAMRAQRVELDAKDLDDLRAKLAALQQDVKAIQFGGMKR